VKSYEYAAKDVPIAGTEKVSVKNGNYKRCRIKGAKSEGRHTPAFVPHKERNASEQGSIPDAEVSNKTDSSPVVGRE